VSLAHRGVLFLDELPEFLRPVLETLRQPLESGHTTVSRAAAHITYPARFQLVAAMNPCRCGHLGEAGRECGRAPRCGEDYLSRLSGPLLDRIDLTVYVQSVTPAELSRAPPGECSEKIAARVAAARSMQRARAGPGMPATNAELDGARIDMAEDARKLAEHAAMQLGLSARGFTRVLRVSRTIADLVGAAVVRRIDVAEALAFRHRIPGRKAA
jgi:magnesium chelatase family protein